jgi:hypothetical protein
MQIEKAISQKEGDSWREKGGQIKEITDRGKETGRNIIDSGTEGGDDRLQMAAKIRTLQTEGRKKREGQTQKKDTTQRA